MLLSRIFSDDLVAIVLLNLERMSEDLDLAYKKAQRWGWMKTDSERRNTVKN